MSNYYLWDRIVGPDPNLRAADADRERVAERLRKGHAEGRLDLTEFQERLERCYEAKTIGQLRELVADLPRQEEQVARRSSGWPVPLAGRVPLVPLLIALIVVVAATAHHVFWLWIPILFLIWRITWGRRRRWTGGPRRGPDDLL